jgi:sugar phosphate isomerase/epimerase
MFRLRPLTEAIDLISKTGFGAIELMGDRPHAFPEDLKASDISALNEQLAERKMTVSNLDAVVVNALGDGHHPSWIEEDWKERETRIRYTLDCLRLSAAVGIPHITIGPGGSIPETMNQREAFRLLVANMHRVLPLAEKLGVKVLVQCEPGGLLESSAQTLELLRELEFHEWLGVNFDPGHFFCSGENPCEAWEKLEPYVGHVNLEDIPADRAHRHVQLGEGAMDIVAFLNLVRESRYEGFVTVKLEAYEQRAEEMAQHSAQYLRANGFMAAQAAPEEGAKN